MAREVVADKSLTRKEADRIKAPFELDMIAFFKELNDEVMRILYDGIENNLTPEEIVNAVEEVFNE